MPKINPSELVAKATRNSSLTKYSYEELFMLANHYKTQIRQNTCSSQDKVECKSRIAQISPILKKVNYADLYVEHAKLVRNILSAKTKEEEKKIKALEKKMAEKVKFSFIKKEKPVTCSTLRKQQCTTSSSCSWVPKKGCVRRA